MKADDIWDALRYLWCPGGNGRYSTRPKGDLYFSGVALEARRWSKAFPVVLELGRKKWALRRITSCYISQDTGFGGIHFSFVPFLISGKSLLFRDTWITTNPPYNKHNEDKKQQIDAACKIRMILHPFTALVRLITECNWKDAEKLSWMQWKDRKRNIREFGGMLCPLRDLSSSFCLAYQRCILVYLKVKTQWFKIVKSKSNGFVRRPNPLPWSDNVL